MSKRGKENVNLEPSYNGQEALSALLVYAEFEPMHTLRVMLANQGIDTWRARSCRQALNFLARFRPVHAIFTDKDFPDGTWLDLVRAKRRTPAPLFVVARETDARLSSADIIQQGGAGLIVPPFIVCDRGAPAVALTKAHPRTRPSGWRLRKRSLARRTRGALAAKA
jgi:CheY-like chemotaxis protein